MIIGYIADNLIKRKYCSIGVARKFANTLGMIGPAICIIILGYITENTTFALLILTAANGLESGTGSGAFINEMDISPNYCAFIAGINFSLGTLFSICGPMLVGSIVTNKVCVLSNLHCVKQENLNICLFLV